MYGSTPLHVSAEFGYLGATKTSVEKGAAVYSTNEYVHTQLMTDAYTGKSEIFHYRREIGTDICKKNQHCSSLCIGNCENYQFITG
jgi:ankyrin repeat protein